MMTSVQEKSSGQQKVQPVPNTQQDKESSASSSSLTNRTTKETAINSALATSGETIPRNPIILPRRHTTIRTKVAAPTVDHVSILCGLLSGMAQAGLFNPVDRALYLSVKNRTPFLHVENFQNPYLGFFQSVGHRALSGGLYFPLEQYFMTVLIPPNTDKNSSGGGGGAFYNLLAGTAAGSVNALIVNPISAVKYKSWGREVNRGMMTEAIEMFHKGGGVRPFYNGIVATILRDLVFGGCYTFLRLELQYRLQLSQEYQWMANFCAAMMATVASGPFNLARNVQYATKSRHVADTVGVVLSDFVQETRDKPTVFKKLRHVQNRLRLGWGTTRVAVGMAFGHYTYDKLHEMYDKSKGRRNF